MTELLSEAIAEVDIINYEVGCVTRIIVLWVGKIMYVAALYCHRDAKVIYKTVDRSSLGITYSIIKGQFLSYLNGVGG